MLPNVHKMTTFDSLMHTFDVFSYTSLHGEAIFVRSTRTIHPLKLKNMLYKMTEHPIQNKLGMSNKDFFFLRIPATHPTIYIYWDRSRGGTNRLFLDLFFWNFPYSLLKPFERLPRIRASQEAEMQSCEAFLCRFRCKKRQNRCDEFLNSVRWFLNSLRWVK